MRLCEWFIGLTVSFGTLTRSTTASVVDSGSPAVSIDLRANWNNAPIELWLLEAIAKENSTSYFPLVEALVNNDVVDTRKLSSRQVYDLVFEHASGQGYIDDIQQGHVKLSLALHRYSALIQAHYQYYETWVEPEYKKQLDVQLAKANCDTWLLYNGKSYCNSDSVFALESINSNSDNDENTLLPFDRVVGSNSNAPLAILYGDILSESFSTFHLNLFSSAENGKIRYVWRYKPSVSSSRQGLSSKENLTGYGVEISVKRTDYLVIDDRENTSSQESLEDDEIDNERSTSEGAQVLLEAQDSSAISKQSLSSLGFRAAGFILNSQSPFDSLVNVSLDFPKYSGSIAALSPDRLVFNEVEANARLGLPSGFTGIFINGATVPSSNDDIFSTLDIIDRERKFAKDFQDLGLNPSQASQLVSTGLNAADDDIRQPSIRYDYRVPGIVWFNDIEKDRPYKRLSSDLRGFLRPSPNGQLHNIRHNAHSIVFAIDPSQLDHLRPLATTLGLLQRGLTIQIGVIPLLTADNKEIVRKLLSLQLENLELAREYIGRIAGGLSEKEAYQKVVANAKGEVKEHNVDFQLKELSEWAKRFELTSSNPVAFANGVLLDIESPEWLYEASDQFQRDIEDISNLILDEQISENNPIRDALITDSPKSRNVLVSTKAQHINSYANVKDIQAQLRPYWNKIPHLRGSTFYLKGSESPLSIWISGRPSLTFFRQLVVLFNVYEQRAVKLTVIPCTDEPSVWFSTLNYIFESKEPLKALEAIVTSWEVSPHETDPKSVWRALEKFGIVKESLEQDSSELQKVLKGIPEVWSFDYNNIFVNGRILPVPKDVLVELEDLLRLLTLEQGTRLGHLQRLALDFTKELKLGQEFEEKWEEFDNFDRLDAFSAAVSRSFYYSETGIIRGSSRFSALGLQISRSSFEVGETQENATLQVLVFIDPLSAKGQKYTTYVKVRFFIYDLIKNCLTIASLTASRCFNQNCYQSYCRS